MPLVSRTSNQGNFFKEDSEPPNWENADLWADTDASPRALFINNNGTALALGTPALDEIGSDVDIQTGVIGSEPLVGLSNPGTTYVIRSAVTVTVDNDGSGVALVGWATYRSDVSRTAFVRIREAAVTVVAETSSASTAEAGHAQSCSGLLTDVTSGSHTYNLETRLSVSDGTDDLLNTGIHAIVIG